MPTVQCEKLSLGYREHRDVLKDITFSLETGSFHFLAGASGAGKSSLLRLLSLSHQASHGTLAMFGKDVTHPAHDALPALRRRIGMVYQDYRLLDHLTVEENVGLPLKIVGESRRAIREKVHELLAWVGLEDYPKLYPEVLSGGQKQRVAIARAVINKPDLLLADEPSGNLDKHLSMKFMYLFEALHKGGTTILYATHDEQLINQFHYPVLRLQDGKLANG